VGDHHDQPRTWKRHQNVEGARFPHSLDWLFVVHGLLRLRINSGEYKLMGLARMANRNMPMHPRELLDIKPDGSFWLNPDYFIFSAARTMTNEAFYGLFGGPPRGRRKKSINGTWMWRWSIQVVTEEIMLLLARHAAS